MSRCQSSTSAKWTDCEGLGKSRTGKVKARIRFQIRLEVIRAITDDSVSDKTGETITLLCLVFFMFHLGVVQLHLSEVPLHPKPRQQTEHKPQGTNFLPSTKRKQKHKTCTELSTFHFQNNQHLISPYNITAFQQKGVENKENDRIKLPGSYLVRLANIANIFTGRESVSTRQDYYSARYSLTPSAAF